MKTKINLFAACLIVLALAFSACTSQTTKTEPTVQSGTEKIQYTCPMHPEVITDKPGKCPKCGMDLVKKEPTMNMDSTQMKNMKK